MAFTRHSSPGKRKFAGFIFTILVLSVVFLHQPGAHAQTAGEPLVEELTIQLTEKGTDVYYLQARLGSISTELLFDTGSGYLALIETLLDTLEKEGRATYQRKVRARLANGRISEIPIYRVDVLSLGENCSVHDVEAAMLKGSTRNILGMNVLRSVESFAFSFSDETLTLRGCGSPRLAGL